VKIRHVIGIMNKYLILLILILIGCGPTPTAVPLVPETTPNSPSVIPPTPGPQDVIPTVIIQPTQTVASAPVTSGSLWLQVLSPQDEAVINIPQVDVIGSAPAGTVVSVNEEILIVGDDQQFKITVSLDEGPNLIEILASDENGNEMSFFLTVTYEP
jgi:hypothetical protein